MTHLQITIAVEDDGRVNAEMQRIDPDGSQTNIYETDGRNLSDVLFDVANDVANKRIPNIDGPPKIEYPIGTTVLLHQETIYVRGAGGWYFANASAEQDTSQRSIEISTLDDATVRTWSKNPVLCTILFEPKAA